MNQEGIAATITEHASASLENQHVVNTNQGQPYLPSTTGSEASSWTPYKADITAMQNGTDPNCTYHYEQPPVSSSSNLGTANAAQDYNGYAAYNPSDPYGYGSTGYSGYYSGYQQQANPSVGAHQNTGAPYQPISSFPNSGSYAASASYSSTYYNPGDYQTTGAYQNGSYNSQTTQWNDATYTNYNSQQYAPYNPGTAAVYNPTPVPAPSVNYQHHYKQWPEYYPQADVTCAPGTENSSANGGTSYGLPTSVAPSASYQQPLPPPPPLPSWRPESVSSELPPPPPPPPVQPGAAHDGYWRHGYVAPASQSYHTTSVDPQIQKPPDQIYSYNSFQDPQNSSQSQGYQVPPTGSSYQYTHTHQVPKDPQSYQPPPQNGQSLDTRKVSKMQIPTNPSIASSFTVGLPKVDKNSSTTSQAMKPAYISVSMQQTNEKVSSSVGAEVMLKPGSFPKSLRGYVERALARCKDDLQMAACQGVMKEMITKATADGTLCLRDWDVEPLFPMPTTDATNQDSASNVTPISSLENFKQSPRKRSKSRWEPMPEVEKPSSSHYVTSKYTGWSDRDRKTLTSNTGGKVENLGAARFPFLEQKSSGKFTQKAVKRQRLMDTNGDTSSDSDKEQSSTANHNGAMALADSAEERKRRESRSKRFDKGPRRGPHTNHHAGSGNLYSRRATAMALSKSFEEGSNMAVEDIDWDAFTVKGTCQEIEKRYLRLTSAPDHATVRPEEVLEKALLMVHNSQKNYLFKCDQLKSIRQDLTVQRIRNHLTVKVYETHARLALEFGDLPEYNQCQSQLTFLYAEGNDGCHMEFAAYNLLCVIMHSNNNRDLVTSMSRLSVEAKKDKGVKHALAVRGAVTSGNYVMFFRLYKTAPNLNTCIMDLYVEKMRFRAVNCMSRSYRPLLPVSYIAQVLGFSSTTNEGVDEKDSCGLEDCVEWLKVHGACIVDNNGELQLDTKATASSLFMPEPEDAVSHGDANLAVNDFLTRTALQVA